MHVVSGNKTRYYLLKQQHLLCCSNIISSVCITGMAGETVNKIYCLMIIVFRFVPYSAMALYPFILVKRKELKSDEVLLNHERIHHRQQVELLLVFFYLFYGINYLYNLLRYRQHYTAYRQIIFEREAFAMDQQADYLKHRKRWAFRKF